jgi:H+/Cl- antiporter ClcA
MRCDIQNLNFHLIALAIIGGVLSIFLISGRYQRWNFEIVRRSDDPLGYWLRVIFVGAVFGLVLYGMGRDCIYGPHIQASGG